MTENAPSLGVLHPGRREPKPTIPAELIEGPAPDHPRVIERDGIHFTRWPSGVITWDSITPPQHDGGAA